MAGKGGGAGGSGEMKACSFTGGGISPFLRTPGVLPFTPELPISGGDDGGGIKMGEVIIEGDSG